MKKNLAKKLHNRDEVILKKSFDGKERILSLCGNPKVLQNFIFVDLFESNGSVLRDVPHKFLK